MPALTKKTLEITYNNQPFQASVVLEQFSDEWIVGLHGLQSDKTLYSGLFEQNFLSNYSKLAIDFVGFGESDKPDTFSYTVEDQADVVLQILRQLEIKRMHLVGHSLGGMTGTLLLQILGNRPLSFANLEGNLVYADCGASREVIKYSLDEFTTKRYQELQDKIKQSSEPSAVMRAQWIDKIPAHVFYKSSLSIVEWSKSEKLKDIFNNSSVKRLFMYGGANIEKSASVSDTVQKVEISNAGHFMLIDQPDKCYQALNQFILD